MREFNTTGPCNPTLHYTVMREALIEVGREKVNKGRFFTLFAPRQSGKTTYFQLLLKQLNQEGYTAVWVSFESMKTLSREWFYKALTSALKRALPDHTQTLNLTNQVQLLEFFNQLKSHIPTLVIIIDEFEGIPDEVLGEMMHTFREIYHQKENYALHALGLVGISTVADLVVGPASPFNIADELEITYFTLAETTELINQYITETGQPFDDAVIQAIYANTQGQPGLVCALCNHLVTKRVLDKSQPIMLEHFYQTLTFFMTQRAHLNIMNIVQKARQKRAFMLKLLFQPVPIPFSIYEPDMAWLEANGVIDEVNGYVDVAVPLYKKVLISAFRPLINGEAQQYVTSARDVLGDYLVDGGAGLNINALLQAYRAYVQRRGFQAFDTENLREGAWHYSLDSFLNFFIEQLGGQTYIEIPSGRGRIDILIRYQEQSYIIETKIYGQITNFKQGKAQLAEYLKTEGLAEGYYVVFSNVHTEQDTLYTIETISGKQIITHIIRTNFDRPSQLNVPDELKA